MPIPATVVVDRDGVPDFAALDSVRARNLGRERSCALCGQKMRGVFAFIGGENTIANSMFIDGPMHHDCAMYAFVVCPYVSGSHREYREEPKKHEDWVTSEIESVIVSVKAARMGILIATDYAETPQGFWFVKNYQRERVIWEEELREGVESQEAV